MKKTLILGATDRQDRYAYIAANMLTRYGHPIVPFGKHPGKVAGEDIVVDFPDKEEIDTVTLYMNPFNQVPFIDKILELKPKRIIFNPGTENPDFEKRAEAQGIEAIEGCTLVMLGSGQY